jgi:predicted acylesterase/phospholipase RssA
MAEEKKITEICLAGACNRGIAYVGAFKKLEEMNKLSLKKMVGVSIGSFIAACYIIGYTSEELLDEIIQQNTDEFKDISISEDSILKGEKYKKWVHEIISKKENPEITMSELYKKTGIELIIISTCIYSELEEYPEGIIHFSHTHTPDVPLFIAITSSMAFPFIFPPVVYKNCKFIDGAVVDNFPINLVSIDSLCIKVNFKPIVNSTKNPISYIGKIFELLTNRISLLKNEKHENIVCINCTDFNVIDFDMSIDDKITLYKRGHSAIEKFYSSSLIELSLE